MTIPTDNVYVDAVLLGGNDRPGNTFTYFFDDNDVLHNGDTIKGFVWTEEEKVAFRAALNAWSKVADVSFSEAGSVEEADFVQHKFDTAGMTALNLEDSFGASDHPLSADDSSQAHTAFNWEKYNFPGPDGYSSASLEAGGLAYWVYIHQIGHVLGLAHPDSDEEGSSIFPGVATTTDLGVHELNQAIYSVMSLNPGWNMQDPLGAGLNSEGYNTGPGAIDIAAIQYLYGANLTYKGGDDVYKLRAHSGLKAIWDTGGNDTIEWGGKRDAVIDLRPATLDGGANTGGYVSYVKGNNSFGGFTIADDFTNVLADERGQTGVIIENAVGGSGDDLLNGNRVDNLLEGKSGDDVLNGRGGNDSLEGSYGDDLLRGQKGDDVVRGGNGEDILSGNNGNDHVIGGAGKDDLRGGNGNDTLKGGTGADTLRGGNGADVFEFSTGDGADRIKNFDAVSALHDVIDLSGLESIKGWKDLMNNHLDVVGDDVLIDGKNGDEILLKDVDFADLDKDDFLF